MTTRSDLRRPPINRVVIGIGNDDRQDDGAGLAVARRLRGCLPLDVGVEECYGDLTHLLDLWEGARFAILADAVRAPRAPGSVVRLEGEELDRISTSLSMSTHGTSLGAALDLARSLGSRPARVVVYGIVAAEVSHGKGLSEAVAAGVETAARRIEAEFPSPTQPNVVG